MSTLTCIETYIDNEKNYYSSFLIEPLQIGQGITLGNSLRRTLLSDLSGFSITGARINDLKHEFATIEGIREDTVEILLNLKQIVFKSSFLAKEKIDELKGKNFKLEGFLNAKGPCIITAGMLNLPKDILQIINPNQYICTLVKENDFFLEVDIEYGIGYRLTEETRKKNILEKFQLNRPSTLLVDAVFMPIRTVNYKIKLIHDSKGNIKESLALEVVTNGSITPKRSVQEALKLLMNLFYPLLLMEEAKFI